MDKAYFISDVHLGAKYIPDARAHELRIVEFLRSLPSDTTHLFLLGDILDYWYEYRTVVPRGYVRFFGEIARLSDAGVKITWMTGNHDIWLFDYLSSELGIEVIDAPLIERQLAGKKIIMGHGDRIGERSLGFRFICSLFRNKICQKLFASIHPRWTVPFAHKWSAGSRKEEGEHDKQHEDRVIRLGESIVEKAPNTDYIIIGHHHIEMEHKLTNRTNLIVLGEWINLCSYAVISNEEPLRLERF